MVPPRVGITVEAADADTVTITRITPDGREVLINGRDIPIAGSTYVEDYTAGWGVPLQYVATAVEDGVPSAESAPTDPVTLTVTTTGAWLSDPSIPGSSIEIRVNDWTDKEFDTETTTVLPLGGSTPVALLGARQSAQFTLITRAMDITTRDSLRGLLATAPLLLLRPSPVLDEPARYIAVGKVRERRLTIGKYEYELPMTESLPPAVGVRYGEPGKQLQDLEGYYPTLDDLAATGKTLLEIAKDPRP